MLVPSNGLVRMAIGYALSKCPISDGAACAGNAVAMSIRQATTVRIVVITLRF